MSDHAKFVATATRLINKHGREVQLKVLSSHVADSTKPWKGVDTPPTAVSVMAAFVPFRGFEFGSMFLDDELLKSVDEVCLVAANGTELEKSHIINDESVDYKIEWARRLKPGGQVILYAFGVNR